MTLFNPRLSDLYLPEHLTKTRGLPEPDPEGDIVRLSAGQACAASQDGLLLLGSYDVHATATLLAKQGGNKVWQVTGLADPYRLP